MTTTHTPGPWTFDQEDDNSTDFWVFQANGPARIAVEVSERDAALIAAAPDLLAALEAADRWVAMYHNLPGHDAASRCMTAVIRAAIAKATGA